MFSADERGNLGFEVLYLILQNEGAAIHDINHGSENLFSLLPKNMRVSKKRNLHNEKLRL